MSIILTNSTVYLGTNLFGKVEKFTCPEAEISSIDIKVGYGTIKLPVGVEALSASMDLLCLDKTVHERVANPFNQINFTVYGSLSEFKNETLENEKQAKLIIRANLAKKKTLGELVQQEKSNFTVDFNVAAYKLIVADEEWEYFDPENMIWKIHGKDVLAKLKKNLALS